MYPKPAHTVRVLGIPVLERTSFVAFFFHEHKLQTQTAPNFCDRYKMSRVRARPLHGRVKKIQFFEDLFNTLEAISYTHFVAKDSDSDSKIEELQRVDQPTNCAN